MVGVAARVSAAAGVHRSGRPPSGQKNQCGTAKPHGGKNPKRNAHKATDEIRSAAELMSFEKETKMQNTRTLQPGLRE